jgi:hypothetical protein
MLPDGHWGGRLQDGDSVSRDPRGHLAGHCLDDPAGCRDRGKRNGWFLFQTCGVASESEPPWAQEGSYGACTTGCREVRSTVALEELPLKRKPQQEMGFKGKAIIKVLEEQILNFNQVPECVCARACLHTYQLWGLNSGLCHLRHTPGPFVLAYFSHRVLTLSFCHA